MPKQLHHIINPSFIHRKTLPEINKKFLLKAAFLTAARSHTLFHRKIAPVLRLPQKIRRKPSEADFGGKRRNPHQSAVFGEAGNGTAVGISELELMVGIEPTTFSLRVRCSAIEPHQRIRLFPLGLVVTNQLLYRLSYTSVEKLPEAILAQGPGPRQERRAKYL